MKTILLLGLAPCPTWPWFGTCPSARPEASVGAAVWPGALLRFPKLPSIWSWSSRRNFKVGIWFWQALYKFYNAEI